MGKRIATVNFYTCVEIIKEIRKFPGTGDGMEAFRNCGNGGGVNGRIPELGQRRRGQWKDSGIGATEEGSMEGFRNWGNGGGVNGSIAEFRQWRMV